MLAVNTGPPCAYAEQGLPIVNDEPVARLLQRVQRLLDAEAVLGLYIGPHDQTANVVAGVGELGAIGILEMAALAFARGRQTEITSKPFSVDGVAVARLSLATECDEVIVITVALEDELLLVFAARSPEIPPFTINEERAVRRMSGWIGDYARLCQQLRRGHRRADRLQAALNLIGTAAFVLDGRARLTESNETGRQLLEAGDGLRTIGGMLTASDFGDSVRLQMAIAHAGSAAASAEAVQRAPVLSVRRKGQRPLSVVVMQGRTATSERDNSVVIVLAVDPQCDVTGPLMPACAIYGLTGAEARLVTLIVGGASLTQAAARLRIQEPTARTYLKQIFVKTGTNRQAALVHLLLTTIVRAAPTVELTAVYQS